MATRARRVLDAVPTAAYLAAAALVALLSAWPGLGTDVVRRMQLGVDCAHQIAQLAWIHRSLFLGAGPLLSQPLFYPLPGILTTSELPLLPGIIFGAFRELGAYPSFAWNLTLGLGYAASAVAMFLAARAEEASPVASFVAAAVYVLGGWIGQLGDAVYYRYAFGPPLVWLLLSGARRGGASYRYVLGLASVVFLQLAACATVAMASLLVLVAGLSFDTRVRTWRVVWRSALAILPTAGAALAWAWVSGRWLRLLELADVDWLGAQVSLRMDVVNFLPRPTPTTWLASNNAAGWIEGFAGVEFWPGFVIVGLVASALIGDRWRSTPTTARIWRPWWVDALAAGAGVALVHAAWAALVSPDLEGQLPGGQILAVTDVLWVAGVLVHRLLRRGSWVRPEVAVLCVALACALGPVVYAGGKPLCAGPALILDLVVPGFERIRVPAKLLSAGALALALLSASGCDRLLASFQKRRDLLGVIVVLSVLQRPLYAFWADERSWSVSPSPSACPACSDRDTNVVAPAYQWLQRHAPGQPLLELPMGASEMPGVGSPPYSGHDPTYVFRFALDGIPRLNGFTSWPPPDAAGFENIVAEFPNQPTLSTIRARGARWILLHCDRYPPAERERTMSGLTPPPAGLELVASWGDDHLYRVAAPE
jgi:hypothetical protein